MRLHNEYSIYQNFSANRCGEILIDEFHETELRRNLEFAKKIFDLAMNCLDINEDVANRHIRIAQVEKMIQSLNELKARL